MFTMPVLRRFDGERAWTEHLATGVGARSLLEAARRAGLPPGLADTIDEVIAALTADTALDEHGAPEAQPTSHVVHQLHLDGRFPDVVINDPRERTFAVVEAQRGVADDRHIAKLAAHYVPRSGARLGILVAEGWRRASARHPAWAACPAPVVVVVALDDLHAIRYEAAWVHHPPFSDEG